MVSKETLQNLVIELQKENKELKHKLDLKEHYELKDEYNKRVGNKE